MRGSKLCGRELDSRPRGHRVLFDPWFFIVLESVALRGTREQGERERDTWSRGLRFVSTIRTGSVGLDGICDECTWTFYPTQVYLNVHCVSCYRRAVHKDSRGQVLSPLYTLNERKSALASGGSIAAAREEEREREREYRRVPPSQPLFTSIPSLALYQWTSTSIPTISFIPARSDNPS